MTNKLPVWKINLSCRCQLKNFLTPFRSFLIKIKKNMLMLTNTKTYLSFLNMTTKRRKKKCLKWEKKSHESNLSSKVTINTFGGPS
jgi:hypothetical protein